MSELTDIHLGKFRINPRGEIKPSEQYKFLDLVTYKGSAYLNINNDIIDGVASIAQLPADTESCTKYYMMLVSKGDKGDMADKYDSFIDLSTNSWDYSLSDKVTLPDTYNEAATLHITNVYDGCVGMIVTNKDITLPSNSDISADYNFISVTANQYYVYTFVYKQDANRFIWNRSVYANG